MMVDRVAPFFGHFEEVGPCTYVNRFKPNRRGRAGVRRRVPAECSGVAASASSAIGRNVLAGDAPIVTASSVTQRRGEPTFAEAGTTAQDHDDPIDAAAPPVREKATPPFATSAGIRPCSNSPAGNRIKKNS